MLLGESGLVSKGGFEGEFRIWNRLQMHGWMDDDEVGGIKSLSVQNVHSLLGVFIIVIFKN